MERGRLAWKISVAGTTGVGKSALISRIIYNTDKVQISQRSLQKKTLRLDGSNGPLTVDILLQEIDPGKNEERLMTGSNAVLVLADLTNLLSLKSADRFLKLVESQKSGKIVKLIATKLDRKYEAVLWEDDLQKLGKKYGTRFFLVSSKDSTSVKDMMSYIVNELLQRFYSKRKKDA
jgi:putative ribosome biogenesis GTPase RsgA